MEKDLKHLRKWESGVTVCEVGKGCQTMCEVEKGCETMCEVGKGRETM